MPSRAPRPAGAARQDRAEQAAAVARRLDLLDRELASVRGGAPPAPLSSEVDGPPPALPQPGRHAARRPRGAAWVPEPLRGRVGLGPGPLAVVAVVVALALGATAWWSLRSRPVPVAPAGPGAAAAPLAEPAAEVGTGPTTGPTAEPATVTVDVAGRVRRPGIVVLEQGARVVDALQEAGGARPGTDLTGLNLARLLVDGEQVVVGVPPPATGLPTAPAPAPGAPGAPLVDLNTADLALLETLPEVGPVTAQAIVSWREQHGGFTAVSELLEVDGIGDATLATITPFVTV